MMFEMIWNGAVHHFHCFEWLQLLKLDVVGVVAIDITIFLSLAALQIPTVYLCKILSFVSLFFLTGCTHERYYNVVEWPQHTLEVNNASLPSKTNRVWHLAYDQLLGVFYCFSEFDHTWYELLLKLCRFLTHIYACEQVFQTLYCLHMSTKLRTLFS